MGSLKPRPDTKSQKTSQCGVRKGNRDGERGWKLEKGSRGPGKKILWDGEKTPGITKRLSEMRKRPFQDKEEGLGDWEKSPGEQEQAL